jgi:peptide/nickel transport system substrate-binding protein
MRSRQRRLLVLITLMAFTVLICVGLVLVASVVSRGQRVVAEPVENRIVYGLTLMPSGFDPHINASSELGIVLRSVYDTLLYRDPQTKAFVPGLADKWQISGDGLTYTFHLKTGVKFHDGTPFDASAVAANLDRITDPATKSQKAIFMLGPYDHYTIVDPQTIQVVLKSPYAPLLDAFCQVYLGIASPTALKAYDVARYQFHQVGTGPFYMVDYIPGDHVTLRRYADYAWGPPFYTAPGPQSLEEIEFRFFTDAATRAPALETGEAQVMGELAPADAILFTGNSNIRLYPQPIPGEPLQFLINTTRAPTDKLEMRQALLLATNRTAVVDAVFQQFSPVAYGPLSAVTPFYDPKVRTMYPYDSAAALDLLNKLGYSDTDGDKMLDLNGNKLHLVMIVPPWGLIPQVAQKIQSQWRDLGIELELKQVANFTALVAAAQSGDYNLIAYNDAALDASILNSMYRSDAPTNWMHYASGNLDSWLTRATEASDQETRQNMYTAIQNHVMEQALILPIRDYVNLNGASANVHNLSFDAYGWFPLLANVTLGEPPKPTPGNQ